MSTVPSHTGLYSKVLTVVLLSQLSVTQSLQDHISCEDTAIDPDHLLAGIYIIEATPAN